MFDSHFEGKTLVVTGANQGIGRHAAIEASKLGANVVIASRTIETGQQVETLINKADYGRALFVQTDVSEEESVMNMVETAISHFGSLDMAFNNAGGGATSANPVSTLDQTVDDWSETINSNLLGTWLCMKHEIPEMLKVNKGAIVNMSSIGGVRPVPVAGPAYTAAKTGISGLTGMTGLEFAGRGIRINSIAPTVTLTERWQKNIEENPSILELINETLPLGRAGAVSEVVNCALWLLCDASSFVTGQTISVDGSHANSIAGYQSPKS